MPNNEASGDKMLVSEFLKGKVRAFDLLYEKYSGRLYAFALMLLKNKEDARDIVQEAFLRIWQKRRELAEEKSFKSYLFTISYNIIIDQLRKKLNDKNYLESLEKSFKFGMDSIENTADFNMLDKQIREIIGELPPRRKEIFKMSREKGCSHKEIAETLNISIKTVETQLSLAVKFLKTRLSDSNLAVILLFFLFY
jgi:RNA polymerase sigma-70 factor (family 1)